MHFYERRGFRGGALGSRFVRLAVFALWVARGSNCSPHARAPACLCVCRGRPAVARPRSGGSLVTAAKYTGASRLGAMLLLLDVQGPWLVEFLILVVEAPSASLSLCRQRRQGTCRGKMMMMMIM